MEIVKNDRIGIGKMAEMNHLQTSMYVEIGDPEFLACFITYNIKQFWYNNIAFCNLLSIFYKMCRKIMLVEREK